MTTNRGPSPGPADDYRLPEVPRRLRRRISALMLLVAVAGGALFIFVIALLSGARWSGGGWIGVTVLVACAVVAVTLTARWMSSSDRAAIDAAQRRLLAPLPRPSSLTPAGATPTTIELRPGWLQRRRLAALPDEVAAAASVVVVDDRAIVVPGWLVGPAPRPGDELVRIEWPTVERWRVRAETDGPDLHELTVAGERLTISRLEIVDEIALLDAVRSLGAMTIELEASLDRRLSDD